MITKNWEQKISLKNNLQMLRFGEMTIFIRLYSTCLAVKCISLGKVQSTGVWDIIISLADIEKESYSSVPCNPFMGCIQ